MPGVTTSLMFNGLLEGRPAVITLLSGRAKVRNFSFPTNTTQCLMQMTHGRVGHHRNHTYVSIPASFFPHFNVVISLIICCALAKPRRHQVAVFGVPSLATGTERAGFALTLLGSVPQHTYPMCSWWINESCRSTCKDHSYDRLQQL